MSMPILSGCWYGSWDEIGFDFYGDIVTPMYHRLQIPSAVGLLLTCPKSGVWGARMFFSVFLLYHQLCEVPSYPCPREGVSVRVASPSAVDWYCLLLGARFMWGVVRGISLSLVILSFSQALCVWIWGLSVFSTLAFPHGFSSLYLWSALPVITDLCLI